MSQTIITGIDIGSFYTRVAVLERVDKKTRIIARSSTLTKGVEKGYVTSNQEVKDTLIRALNTVERQMGQKVREVVLSASGTGLEAKQLTTSTITTLGSGEVTDLDISKCTEKAYAQAKKPKSDLLPIQ